MADNITAPASGAVLATDEIGGVHFPRTKIAFGVDGATVDASATNPLPVLVSSVELGATSLAALETTELGAASLAALESITATVTGGATSAKQDETTAAINALSGTEYETVAASATNQALGAAGAIGDLLTSLLIVPATTSPGAVTIKDGAGSAITVFPGGASSIATLHPFTVSLGIRSSAGAWQVTTGANVSVVAAGNFT